MADDLERFLQKAAERLAAKVRQANQPVTAGGRLPPQIHTSRHAERSPQFEDEEEEVLDAELVEDVARRAGPDPLSTIDTRRSVGSNRPPQSMAAGIEQADERMGEHIHSTLDHNIVGLSDASEILGSSKPGVSSLSYNAANPNQHAGRSNVEHRQFEMSPLVALLQDPKTITQAFIAGEIFNRKYDF